MKNLYKGFYQLTDDERNALWDNATIIFDTNVLLNVYRYKQKTREELFKLIDKYSDRVWLPYHVGLEFHRNRLTVISDQDRKYPQFKKIFDEGLQKIQSDVKNLSQKYRHDFFAADKVIEDMEKIKNDFFTDLEAKDKDQGFKKATSEDAILEKINSLFDGKIGEPPESQTDVDTIVTEGEVRFEKEIPPGYLDAKKENSDDAAYHYGGIEYQKKFGDLLIWKQIIQHAKDNELKHIVFITEDDKKDWWWIHDSGNRPKIGARPELIDEISREAGVECFHLYNTASFIKFAGEQEHIQEDDIKDALDDIRDVNTARHFERKLGRLRRHKDRRILGHTLQAVSFWLIDKEEVLSATVPNLFDSNFDLIADKEHLKFGIEINTFGSFKTLLKNYQWIIEKAHNHHRITDVDGVYLVCIIEDTGSLYQVESLMANIHSKLQNTAEHITVVIGNVRHSDIPGAPAEFSPILKIRQNNVTFT